MQTQMKSCLRAPSANASRVTRHQYRAFTAKPVSRVVARAAAEEVASTNGAAAHAAPTPAGAVDFDELSDIIRLVHGTDIVELELKSKKFTLNVRKREALKAAEPTIQYVQAQQSYAMAPPAPAAPAAPAPAAAAAPAAPAPAAPAKVEGVEITSPMAGTYYRAPAPGEAPFVKEGDRVKKGQTVGIIEAMKLMNEIEAEVSGEVIKLLVDNGQQITPGQPLMLIKP